MALKLTKPSLEFAEILRRVSQESLFGQFQTGNARVRYLNNLMAGRTLQFAERLLNAVPEVDTGTSLARLWNEGLRSPDSKTTEFLVKSLVESLDDPAKQKRLKDSIVRAPDYQLLLVPAIVKALITMKELS